MITRLLLIDANISFIVTLKQALESTGQFRVNLAANGQAAQEALLHSQYHAVLLDCELADIDPQALVDLIRQIRPDLPVILMSDDAEQLERAQVMDVQGLLAKPFAARELIAFLRDLIGGVEGPVIAPPDGIARDEFAPPEMPSVVQPLARAPDALSPDEPGEQAAPAAHERRPTELFSAEERAQIRQGLQDLDEFGEPDEMPDDMLDEMPDEALVGEEMESPPLEGDNLLTEFEVFERIQTGQLGRLQDDQSEDWETITPLNSAPPQAEELPHTRPLPWDAEDQPGATIPLAWSEEAPPTRPLGTPEEPPETRVLDDEEEPEETRKLAGTDSLETLLDARAWSERSARLEEPPAQHEDALSPDLESLREFLAADYSEHDPGEFGDVLDAVARSSPEEYERSPDDRAFHDLVESLRPRDAAQQRRTRLDELLASIAADSDQAGQLADSGAAIDYVLDAIRRAGPPVLDEAQPPDEPTDDTTIADVIDGLFEPSFEGVLAALAGEEVGDEDYDEPAYSPSPGTPTAPGDAGQLAPEAPPGDDSPAWLAGYEREAAAPLDEVDDMARAESFESFGEPPVLPQDSRHYPATAALAAVASAEDGDDFSLTQLLEQIEEQLPPLQPERPRLKPLPSWDTDAGLGGARDLETIFDEMEGVEGGEPQLSLADTRPAARPDAYPDAAALDLDAIFAAPEASAPGEEVFPDELRDLADTAQTAADAYASEANVAELFYAGVRQDAWDFAEPPDAGPAGFAPEETPEQAEAAESFAPAPRDEPLPDMAPPGPDWDEISASEEQPAEAPLPAPSTPLFAAEEHPSPPETAEMAAAPLEQGEDAGEADIAQTALRLTQYSLESSAQATMLSRPGRLLASAGDLPNAAIARLLSTVDAAWHTSPAASDALIRYVALPDAGEFLLYSTRVEADMTLSMVFGTNTPLRTIRRQARRLGESLNLMAELPAADEEAPAARTRPRRPEGLAAEPVVAAVAEAEAEAAAPTQDAAPQADEGPYTGYTCLWVPHDTRLELRGEFADSLRGWIVDAAEADRWRVLALDVQTEYVLVSLDVPQKVHPDHAIARLMAATAQRSAGEFPDLAFGQPLWADGYYFAAPPRDLSDREIARFLTFQRQA